MTNEEVTRTMEFILGQQAQIDANFQRYDEERIRDRPRLARLEESFQLLVKLAQTTDSRLDRVESKTSELESTTSDLEANTSELAANMAALAASQAHADERLSALIDIVREDRNGDS